jgi:hypothetical protein
MDSVTSKYSHNTDLVCSCVFVLCVILVPCTTLYEGLVCISELVVLCLDVTVCIDAAG